MTVSPLLSRHDFRLITGGPHGDCKVKLACKEKRNQLRKKAPPPRWTDPTPVKGAPSLSRMMEVEEDNRAKELEELQKEYLKTEMEKEEVLHDQSNETEDRRGAAADVERRRKGKTQRKMRKTIG